jgi:hypothetical protein
VRKQAKQNHTVFSFLPAQRRSGADRVVHELESILSAETRLSVRLADFSESRVEDDLETLYSSDGIFIVADSDAPSVHAVRDKIALLDSLGLASRCGVLLRTSPKGIRVRECEDLTGAPVCSLIDTGEQLGLLVKWLTARPAAPGFSSEIHDLDCVALAV